MIKTFIKIALIFLMAFQLCAQGKLYEGPDDPAGDIAAEREGYMTGNRVFLYFQNTTELSDWPRVDVSKWPNDLSGSKMTDGINVLITSEVYLENDSIPVTDIDEINSRNDLDTLWFCQTSFRGGMDEDPTGTVQWGLYPVFGYFNEGGTNENPAMSNNSDSWPVEGWPAPNDATKWQGEWNGRFGRGVFYADLETYVVTNDAQDLEYLGPEDELKYYPRPGVKIGDKKPDVTIQAGEPWGGLGIRVDMRGYQWNNPLARDAIFFEYNVSNISDYDLPRTAFGYHVDNAIGGDGANDELGFFDGFIDMAYSWDVNGVGIGGLATGTMGFAFLESPGLSFDGIDNDQDGIIDEARDNQAQNFIGAEEGYADLGQFMEFYGLTQADLKPHWDADEDQDWNDGVDANGNGRYDIDENAGDDVGLDGVGPTDLNWTEPDEGEGNHRPDFVEGIGSEPNFAAVDISESDMLGLTTFSLFHVTATLNNQPRTFHADWVMWQLTGTGYTELWTGGISNLIEVFASGPFPLYKGRTERISMSMLHSFDDLAGLESAEHLAPNLFKLKKTVQLIYESDYRFAQPPKLPTLSATAGDGKVILTWDDVADKNTREPFLDNINDFEGYKLIRASDKKFQDARVITDGEGNPTFFDPIFQCDLKDEYSGYAEYGMYNGVAYEMGSNTGITHYYVDNEVSNGKTYYYGLIAYDYGIPDLDPAIGPSENNLVIELDEFENITYIGQNVAVATPHQMAAGYQENEIEIVSSTLKEGTGSVVPSVVARDALKADHTYVVKFLVDKVDSVRNVDASSFYSPAGYNIYDVTNGGRVLLAGEDARSSDFFGKNFVYDSLNTRKLGWFFKLLDPIYSDLADGVQLAITSVVQSTATGSYDWANSGWTIGNAVTMTHVTEDGLTYFPWDHELIWTGNDAVYTAKARAAAGMIDENGDRIDRDNSIYYGSYPFFMINKSFTTESGYDTLDVVTLDDNQNGAIDLVGDRFIFGALDNRERWTATLFVMQFEEMPQPGDVYFHTFIKPFSTLDSLVYKVNGVQPTDLEALETEMDKIKVVPNPYVATNAMEPSFGNWQLNQQRRILFTHLPAKCEITIFTSSGSFVDQILVENSDANGTVHWDLRSDEGLDVAAGMYLYHVKALATDAEKIGKFAILK
jgi:hypothetical protein